MIRAAWVWLACLIVLLPGVAGSAEPLSVRDVWKASRALPVVEAARRKAKAARAKVLEKEGAFDVKLKSKVDWEPVGYYRQVGADAGVSVQTPWYGLRMRGGYRIGRGYPIYKFDRETALGGEVWANLEVPLWRGGITDEARTDLEVARLGTRMADYELAGKRLEVVTKAGLAHADWLAAVHRLRISEQLLKVAEDRAGAFRERVEAGAIPEITLADNDRIIAERRAKVASRQAKAAAKAAKLGLFLASGAAPGAAQAADALPDPALGALPGPRQVELAMLDNRPDLGMLGVSLKQVAAQQRLADNQLAPNIDVYLEGSQGIAGGDPTLTQPELRVGVSFTMPLQRRKARGAEQAAAQTLAALEAQREWLLRTLKAELAGVLASIEAGRRYYAGTSEAIAAAEKLLQATRQRFDAGAVDLFAVYLREEAVAKASEERVAAWLALRVDRLMLRALAARDACIGDPCLRVGAAP